MSADQMQRLPVNTNQQPSPQEARIMGAMFGTTNASSVCNTSMKLILSGIVFFVLNTSFADKFIKKQIQAADVVILAIKTGIFLLILGLAQFLGL